MKKTALIKKVILATVLLLLGAVAVKNVSAQSILPLSVVPPKQDVLVNPGERFDTSVKFMNQGDTPITGTLSVVDFIVQDNNGTPVFLDNPQIVGTTTIPEKYSAAKWITLTQESITIASKGNVAVPITINVPSNAAPGGRYAAVLFQPGGNLTLGNPASAQESAVAVRLASLLYIRIAGPITEDASVTKFQAPNFLEYGPVGITTEILNEGDYQIAPQGNITLKDMFGRVVETSALNSVNIFPGVSRIYNNKLGEKLMIGKFTANLSATYGDSNKELSSTLTMWIFPWKVALAILLAIIIIILVIVLWYKKVVKKEEKLVEALKEEKTELESLKEKFKDHLPPQTPIPPAEKKS
jgi:hypothetical protein